MEWGSSKVAFKFDKTVCMQYTPSLLLRDAGAAVWVHMYWAGIDYFPWVE